MRRTFSALALLGLALFAIVSPVAAAEPTKIQVLLITGDDVAVHPWKVTSVATSDILKATGRFDVTISEDLSPLDSADTLKKYDVIAYLRYDRSGKISDEAKKNLLDFVKGGKGFYVQHLASASFPKWAEFGKLCGRYWVMGKSGHGPRSVFENTVADAASPIAKGIPSFKADDELYAKLQGNELIHVIIAADSDWSKKTEPLVFSREYGQGRVLHVAYGHDGKALESSVVKTLIARGVEWAATGKVSQ